MRRKLVALFSTAALICTLTLIAGTVLAANPAADLDQCANGRSHAPNATRVTAGGTSWVNGNLGAQQVALQRGRLSPVSPALHQPRDTGPNANHTVIIEWDTTKGGKHALDYLTTFNRTVGPGANPIVGVAGSAGQRSTHEPIPEDPQVDWRWDHSARRRVPDLGRQRSLVPVRIFLPERQRLPW